MIKLATTCPFHDTNRRLSVTWTHALVAYNSMPCGHKIATRRVMRCTLSCRRCDPDPDPVENQIRVSMPSKLLQAHVRPKPQPQPQIPESAPSLTASPTRGTRTWSRSVC